MAAASLLLDPGLGQWLELDPASVLAARSVGETRRVTGPVLASFPECIISCILIPRLWLLLLIHGSFGFVVLIHSSHQERRAISKTRPRGTGHKELRGAGDSRFGPRTVWKGMGARGACCPLLVRRTPFPSTTLVIICFLIIALFAISTEGM